MLKYYIYQCVDENGFRYIGKTLNKSKRKYDHINRFKNTGVRDNSNSTMLGEGCIFEVLTEITTSQPWQANYWEQKYIDMCKLKYKNKIVNVNKSFRHSDIVCYKCMINISKKGYRGHFITCAGTKHF